MGGTMYVYLDSGQKIRPHVSVAEYKKLTSPEGSNEVITENRLRCVFDKSKIEAIVFVPTREE